MDITEWLTELGLAQFTEAFSANGVDSVLLPELTNEDLKDLGVDRLADRKKILKAISDLADDPIVEAHGAIESSATTEEPEGVPNDAK